MKLWSRPDKEQREPAKSVRVGAWMRRLALLTFVLVELLGPYLQGYQGSQDEPLTVSIADADGGAVPNVEVVLMREGKLLARIKTGADGRASARVSRGLVTLSVHQTGYIPVEQVVDTRSMPEPVLEIRILTVPQARETVNVQATTENISEQNSSPGVSIKPAEANESPMRPLTLTDALPLVPGVVRAPTGQTQIEGSGEMHSALVINSVDVSDPATGRFGLSVPIDVVDSLHVLTSPYLAQYGRFTAGVVTAETRPGGDKWHFDLNDPLPEFRIRSGHVRGLKSAIPRASFGGPIVQNCAFFSEGLEFVDNKIPIRTLPFPFNETKITSVNSFTQADFTLTPRQTLTATFHAAPQSIRYANLDFFNPQAVTPNDDTRPYTGAITHRLAIGEGLLQSTFSLSDIATTISPQGNLGMTVLPTGNSGNYFADQQRHSRRFESNELWSLKPMMTGLGMHKIQFGSSVASTNDEGQLHAKTITMFDGQGAKLRTIAFTPGSSFDRSDLQPAVFVQDHWTFNSHLAVDAGIRAEAQTITATTRIAPRMGFVWSPTVSERTTVRGGIGAFYDSVPLNVYAFSHYPEQIITTYQPDGTVVGTPQHYLNLTSEAAASEFPFVDRDHKIGNFAPYTVAWNLEAEHRFSEHLTMRTKYLESHGSGLITISPEVVQGQNAFVLAGDGSSRYRQFELTAQLSFQPNHRIYASYVRSLSQGSLNESDTYLGDFSSFIRGNLYTNRAGDLPNRFLTWGSVALPWKVEVYPMIEWRSGFPYQSVDVYQNYIQSMKADSARFPTYFSADARVAKDIKLNSKYTLRRSISITNITNHFNALEVHSNTADPQDGKFFGNYDRHMRFDLDLVF